MATHREKLSWLEEQCNRFANGMCSTAACLRKPMAQAKAEGRVASYDDATCIPYELWRELIKKEEP